MGETVLQGPIPSLEKLCCVVAQIDLSETQDSSAKSNFHWKTFKCRLILDTMRDSVIACPVYETLGSIHVITSVEFFKSQLFQKNLREINIVWSSPRPVTPDVYANCLRYSICFAIAPRWNRVGQYLIAGKYFLMHTASNIATRFKLTLETTNETKTNATMKIQPLKIKQCYLSLEADIFIPHEVIAHFMADPEGKIDVTSFGNHRVTVLPSLKRGKLMAILKAIPASCPFKNYGELRRHWKNMYGYRLPESDIGIIYYDVYFATPNVHRFVYPDICVRSRFVETPYLGNREALVQSFLADVTETVPTICGQSFKIVKKSGNSENSTTSSSSYCQGSFNEENESPDEIDATAKDSQTLLKTPPRRVNAHAIDENLDETTRLSFSYRYKKQQQLRRDLSSLMSPTPSLRGIRTTQFVSPVLIGKVRDTKSSALRLARTMMDDEGPESQNCCPNAAGSERPRAQEMQEPVGQESSPANSQVTNGITRIFVPRKFQEESPSVAEMRNKPEKANYDVVSKYFETQDAGSNEVNSKLKNKQTADL